MKKPVNKIRVLFILSCIVLPILNFLVFYVYVNLSSFTMAFTDRNGAFSLDNFVRLYKEITEPDSPLQIALKNTMLTFGVTMIMFPFQVLVSYFIYKKIPLAGAYRFLFFIPTVIFSVAISTIFSRMMAPNGAVAEFMQKLLNLDYPPELLADSTYANIVVIAHLVWLSFPGDLIIWGGTFARIPSDVLEAGKIDGTSWWTEFTKITVPMVWPTVALQMVLKFCAIFGASGAVFLLTKGDYGTMTLSSWMYLQLYNQSGNVYTSNVYNYLSAVGLIMTVIAVAISLVVRKITDKFFNDVEF